MRKLMEDSSPNVVLDREQIIRMPGHINAVSIPKKYRNFQQEGFLWKDIPMFAVLTGINGVGKTELLNALLAGAVYINEPDKEVLVRSNSEKMPHIYLLNGSNQLDQDDHDHYAKSEQKFEKISNDLMRYYKYRGDEGFNMDYLSYPENWILYNEIITQLEQDPEFNPHHADSDIHHKMDYHLRLKLGIHIKEICNPIFLLRRLVERGFITLAETNKLLSEFKFKYKIGETYQYIQKNYLFGTPSTGEMLHFMVLMWKIYAKIFPTTPEKFVLLLDEPDAHLHPPLTYDLVNTLLDSVVGQHNIQVIMTTHRPTTLCLVPENSIWTVESNNGLITVENNGDRRYSIAQLTSDLVSVNEKFRIVFVEASDDVIFYNYVWSCAVRLKALRPCYQVLFKSHGDKRRDTLADNSSCDQVIRLVNKMVVTEEKNATLADFIFGIIDNDMKGQCNSNNLIIPDRYAIENYIFDPVNLFFFLNYYQYPSMRFKAIKNNLQHLQIPDEINNLPYHDLAALNKIVQAIANEMTREIIQYYLQEKDGSLKDTVTRLRQDPRFQSIDLDDPLSQMQTVDYIGGIQINYPQMFLQIRGKQLKHIIVSTFVTNMKPITIKMIIDKIPAIGMLIPSDLLSAMKRLNAEIHPRQYQSIVQQKVAASSQNNNDMTKEAVLKQQISALEAKVKSQKEALANKALVIVNQKATIQSQAERIAELEALLSQEKPSVHF